MITAKDIAYFIGLLFTVMGAGWWLSAKLTAIDTKLQSLVDADLVTRVTRLEEAKLPRKRARR